MESTPITTELLRGVHELEQSGRGLLPHRLPARARAQCADPQLAMAESQPAGARFALRTAATVIELDTVRTRPMYRGAAPRPDGVFDLLVDGELAQQHTATGGDVLELDMATGGARTIPGPVATARFADLPAGEKIVEIWLPHNEITRLVALRSDAPLTAAPRTRPVWLHHGSSISHGSNATHPTGTWPVIAAAAAGLDLINLGMGGSALLDPFTARAMRDTPADVLSVKIGINLVNADLMRLRAFGPAVHGFLDTIRDGHPETPLTVISPVFCGIHEDTPGPGVADFAGGVLRFGASGDPADVARGKLTLRVIRDQLAELVARRSATDPHLTYVDGLSLYGERDAAELPLTDGLHPGPEAHRRIGRRFAEALRG